LLRLRNPNICRPGVIEVDHWRIDKDKAYRLRVEHPGGDTTTSWLPTKLIRREGDEIRHYPDREIWPGSIMEFI